MPSSMSWNLPVDIQKCAARKHPVQCNFNLYGNSSLFAENRKLAPNNDVTGMAIVKVFIVTGCISVLLSAVLLFDRFKWHFWEGKNDDKAGWHRKHYMRLIHVIQRLLLAISDNQLVAGLALLVVLNHQACSISAYHYNIACTMIVLSAITHLNALLSIQDYIHQKRVVALYRILAISMQYVLSAIVLAGRKPDNTPPYFPMHPGPLAIMPAACFLNKNASSLLGFGDAFDMAQNVTASLMSNSTSNSTEANTFNASSSSWDGSWEYIVLVVCFVLTLLVLLGKWGYTHQNNTHKHRVLGIFGMICSGAGIVTTSVIMAIVMNNYHALREGMEVPQWYQMKAVAREALTYSEAMAIFLMASTSIPMVHAITESLAGHKGRRFADSITHIYKQTPKHPDSYPMNHNFADSE